MIRKVFTFLLVAVILYCIVAFLMQLTERKSTVAQDLTKNVPNSAVYLVESKNLLGFIDALNDNPTLWKGISKKENPLPTYLLKSVEKSKIKDEAFPGTLSLHQNGKTDYDLLIQLYTPNFSVANWSSTDSSITLSPIEKYEGYQISVETKDSSVFVTQIDNKLFLAKKAATLKNAIRWNETSVSDELLPNSWLEFRSTRGKSELAHLYINAKQWENYNNEYKSLPENWFPLFFNMQTCLDIKLGLDELRLSGISQPNANNPAYLATGMEPSAAANFNVIPKNISNLSRLHITDWATYLKNLKEYFIQNKISFQLKTLFPNSKTEVDYLLDLEEIFGANAATYEYLRNSSMVWAYTVVNASQFKSVFQDFVKPRREKIANINAYSIDKKLLKLLIPQHRFTDNCIAVFFKNNLYISSSQNAIDQSLREINHGVTLEKSEDFIAFQEKINLTSSYFKVFFEAPIAVEESWTNEIANSQNNTALVYSFIKENRFYFEYFSTFSGANNQNISTEKWEINLDAPLLFKPNTATNHYTKNEELVLINEDKQITLHSKSGRKLWSKKLHNTPLRTALQIDFFNNGKLQLALNTKHTIELIDRNGNDVAPFPVSVASEITSPMLVADYNLNKDYRFIFAAGKTLLNYDKDGKPTKGWVNFEAKDTIVAKPSYIQIGNKDYIICTDKTGNIYVLNRKGEIRFPTEAIIKDAFSQVYLDKGSEIATTSFSYLSVSDTWTTVYLNGKVHETPLPSLGQINQFARVKFGNNTHYVAIAGQDLITLNAKMEVISTEINVKYPVFESGNKNYPILFSKMDMDSVFVMDVQLKTQSIGKAKNANGIITRFSEDGNNYLLLLSDINLVCHSIPN